MKLAEIRDLSDDDLYMMGDFTPLDLDYILLVEKEFKLHDPANLDARVKWVAGFREVVAIRCPRNKCGSPIISDLDLLQASARERLLAFILWKSNHLKP